MDKKASERCPNKRVILNRDKNFPMKDENESRDAHHSALKEVKAKLNDLSEKINRKKKRLEKWEKTMKENLETLDQRKQAYEYELEQLQNYSVGSTGNPVEDERDLKENISRTEEMLTKTETEMLEEKNRMEEGLDELLTEYRKAKRRKERLEKRL